MDTKPFSKLTFVLVSDKNRYSNSTNCRNNAAAAYSFPLLIKVTKPMVISAAKRLSIEKAVISLSLTRSPRTCAWLPSSPRILAPVSNTFIRADKMSGSAKALLKISEISSLFMTSVMMGRFLGFKAMRCFFAGEADFQVKCSTLHFGLEAALASTRHHPSLRTKSAAMDARKAG